MLRGGLFEAGQRYLKVPWSVSDKSLKLGDINFQAEKESKDGHPRSAPVQCGDGPCGGSARIVFSPMTEDVTELVVKEKHFPPY
jgi:hypothetical protein